MTDLLVCKYIVVVKLPRATTTLAMIDGLEEMLRERGTARRRTEDSVVSEVEIEATTEFNLGYASHSFVAEMDQALKSSCFDDFTIEIADA